MAYAALGFATSSNAAAKPAYLRAIELAPSSADVLSTAADRMPFLGDPDLGAQLCDRSFRLNPLAPRWYYANCHAPYFFARRYRDAVDACERTSVGGFELNRFALVVCAASAAEAGDRRRAQATVAEFAHRFPTVSIELFLTREDWMFDRQQEQDRIVASARKAGIRICATTDELRPFPIASRLPECDAERAR